MVNKQAETGYAEDLVRSYVQFGCAEIHAMNLYYKCTSEMENGLIEIENSEILSAHIEKLSQYKDDISQYANLRRGIMRKLFGIFDGDQDMWCQVKHLGIGAMTLFEAYEGSDNDEELLLMAYEANKEFVKALSRFLGTELIDCAACLSDMMKGVH